MSSLNKQPVIGIVPSFDDGTTIPAGGGNVGRIYLRHEYTAILSIVGAVPLVLNQHMSLTSIMGLCDGIIISGGEDIDPTFYGQDRISAVKKVEPRLRFDWESEIIDACDTVYKPILGICYGLQRLNVHYGGTLLQDIPTFILDEVGHDRTEHSIRFLHDFLGFPANKEMIINSRHHQAVDKIADGFTIKALAEDGVTEAIEGRGHFGMQWHPESDETGAHVYRAFIEHCLNIKQ
jgi:putative glutamine amidotransferase